MHRRQVFFDTSKVQQNFFIQQSIHTNTTINSYQDSSVERNWSDFSVCLNRINSYLSSLTVWQWKRKSSCSTTSASPV